MEELNIDQLEVGEWYELKGSTDWLKWFSKHKGIHDGNCEISSEFIQQSSGLEFKKHAYTWCLGYTFRKATKEQLKSFLPKDHPDYPIENSDYKWMLMLEDDVGGNDYEKGEVVEIKSWEDGNPTYEETYNDKKRIAEGKIKPFLTKEEAEKYWDSINVRPVEKSVEKEDKTGKWYTCTKYPKYLVFYTPTTIYGWDTNGKWFDESQLELDLDKYPRLTDTSILKDRFLQEAEKRYSEGDYVKLLNGNTGGCHKNQIYFSNMFFEQISNNIQQFYIDGNLLIFYDGKWAEKTSKPIETPKTKQLSDLKKGDWVKLIFNENTSNFKKGDLYKLNRDWDNGTALIIDAKGNGNGFGNDNLVNFTVPTQQEIDTWEKSLIKDEPKEFVLPEKWCIKQNTSQIVCDWFNRNGLSAANIEGSYTYLVYDSVLKSVDYNDKPIYTKITLEQFEKYVLKSKVTIEDKPKEDMKTIPKYWYIENKYQEVRDYLANTYDEFCIKNWTYTFIGWDESPNHKGCHGFRSADGYAEKATKITIEQFREYFLSKPNKTPQDDYSWWYELEEGDVIESLTDKFYFRKTGERFTVKKHESKGVVYYLETISSSTPGEWKLVSKAKDVKKNAIEKKLNLDEFPTQNLAQQQREILTFQKKCEVFHTFIPQPEETEIVPISKYFKIRN